MDQPPRRPLPATELAQWREQAASSLAIPAGHAGYDEMPATVVLALLSEIERLKAAFVPRPMIGCAPECSTWSGYDCDCPRCKPSEPELTIRLARLEQHVMQLGSHLTDLSALLIERAPRAPLVRRPPFQCPVQPISFCVGSNDTPDTCRYCGGSIAP